MRIVKTYLVPEDVLKLVNGKEDIYKDAKFLGCSISPDGNLDFVTVVDEEKVDLDDPRRFRYDETTGEFSLD